MPRFKPVLTLVLLLLSIRSASAQGFAFTGVDVNVNIPTQQTFVVKTNGKTPVPATLSDGSKWRIAITKKEVTTVLDPKDIESIMPGTNSVAVKLVSKGFAAVTKMLVVFEDTNVLLTASFKAPDAEDKLSTAKGKADADLYFAGGLIAAKHSASIAMIDAKVQLGWPTKGNVHWFGAYGTYESNTDAKPPADSTDVNPDAIGVFYQMDWYRSFDDNPLFASMQLVARPLGGEFSSDPRSGNIMAVAEADFASNPFFGHFALDPFIGVQVGQNKQKPDELFDQPVDLTGYDKIARLTYGLTASYYNFGPKPTTDNPYRLVASFSWEAWALGTDEPFVRSQQTTGEDGKSKRIKVLEMKGGTRNYMEASVTYNFTKNFGIAIAGKRGSQPPLFQFVDSQASLNLTFKAKVLQNFSTK